MRTVMLLLGLAGLLTSCAALTPAQQVALKNMTTEYEQTVVQTEQLVEELRQTYALQDKLQNQLKDKVISPVDAASQIAVLAERALALKERIEFLTARADSLAKRLKEAHEAGTPWWAIVLSILTSGATAGVLKKYLSAKHAVQTVVTAIEAVGAGEVKEAVAKQKDSYANKVVADLFPKQPN